MDDLITHPAFQSGIAPFIIAFSIALVLRRLGGYWAALGFIVGFFTAVYLTIGLQIFPLTSTRKILLLGAIITVLGLINDSLPRVKYIPPVWIAIISSALLVWVLWPVLINQSGLQLAITVLSSTLYVAWINYAFAELRRKTILLTATTSALGMGTGISALLGASALLGQLGIAIGTASLAFIVLQLLNKDCYLGSSFTMPAALITSFLGISAVVYASLPWYSLVPLFIIPMLIVPSKPQHFFTQHPSTRKQIVFINLAVFTCAGISVAITWQTMGSPLY